MEFETLGSLEDCEEFARTSFSTNTNGEKPKLFSGPGAVIFPFTVTIYVLLSVLGGWVFVSTLLQALAILFGVVAGIMLMFYLLRFGLLRFSVKQAKERYLKTQGEEPHGNIYRVDEKGIFCAAKNGDCRYFNAWGTVERVKETENLVIFAAVNGLRYYFNKKFLENESEARLWAYVEDNFKGEAVRHKSKK